MNHLIQIRTSERVCESFDSDRDFGAWIMNDLIQIGTFDWVHKSVSGLKDS